MLVLRGSPGFCNTVEVESAYTIKNYKFVTNVIATSQEPFISQKSIINIAKALDVLATDSEFKAIPIENVKLNIIRLASSAEFLDEKEIVKGLKECNEF